MVVILFLVLLPALCAKAELREWRVTTGTVYYADFVEMDGPLVTLRMQDGTLKTFLFLQLRAKDRAYLIRLQRGFETPENRRPQAETHTQPMVLDMTRELMVHSFKLPIVVPPSQFVLQFTDFENLDEALSYPLPKSTGINRVFNFSFQRFRKIRLVARVTLDADRATITLRPIYRVRTRFVPFTIPYVQQRIRELVSDVTSLEVQAEGISGQIEVLVQQRERFVSDIQRRYGGNALRFVDPIYISRIIQNVQQTLVFYQVAFNQLTFQHRKILGSLSPKRNELEDLRAMQPLLAELNAGVKVHFIAIQEQSRAVLPLVSTIPPVNPPPDPPPPDPPPPDPSPPDPPPPDPPLQVAFLGHWSSDRGVHFYLEKETYLLTTAEGEELYRSDHQPFEVIELPPSQTGLDAFPEEVRQRVRTFIQGDLALLKKQPRFVELLYNGDFPGGIIIRFADSPKEMAREYLLILRGGPRLWIRVVKVGVKRLAEDYEITYVGGQIQP